MDLVLLGFFFEIVVSFVSLAPPQYNWLIELSKFFWSIWIYLNSCKIFKFVQIVLGFINFPGWTMPTDAVRCDAYMFCWQTVLSTLAYLHSGLIGDIYLHWQWSIHVCRNSQHVIYKCSPGSAKLFAKHSEKWQVFWGKENCLWKWFTHDRLVLIAIKVKYRRESSYFGLL